MRTFDFAISLGPNCRSAHQLRRVYGDAALSGPFDWQITPRRSVCAAIRSDFAGLFERDDLYVGPNQGVMNKRTGAYHSHDFDSPADVTSIERRYADSRSRHDYLTNKLRRLLHGDKLLLLCLGDHLLPLPFVRLWFTLKWRYPRLRFVLLNGPRGDGQGPHMWEGSDEVWDRHFAGFAPSGIQYLRTPLDETVPPEIVADLASPARR